MIPGFSLQMAFRDMEAGQFERVLYDQLSFIRIVGALALLPQQDFALLKAPVPALGAVDWNLSLVGPVSYRAGMHA